MFRRYISLLLLLGIFASQVASIPHAHSVAGAGEHDDRSHVHLAWFCHGHEHSGVDYDRSKTAPGRSIEHDGDHDADAIYLAMNPVPGRAFGRELTAAKVAPFGPLPIAVPSGLPFGDLPAVTWCKSLPLRAPDCALYLALRALRI